MRQDASHLSRWLILSGLLIAVWPVWRWMAARFIDTSDAHWEACAAITAFAFLWRDRNASRGLAWSTLPVLLLLAYAVTYAFVPPLVRALLAITAIGAACSSLWYGRPVELPLCGLLVLSLPLMASLDFYLGYPLRVIVGDATAWLLRANGIAVVREGTLLLWGAQRISIDAPCSGIKMLWSGAYLCFALAALMRLDMCRTLVLAVGAGIVIVVANILRATSLFYVEAGFVHAPSAAHDGIGIVMFVCAACALASMSQRLARDQHAQ
jgi:exosortase